MFFRKFLSSVLIFLFLFEVFTLKSNAIRVAAGEDLSDIAVPIDSTVTNAAIGSKLEISAKSVVLLEAHTGQVLYEDNSSEKLPPASITKIMSLLLVMEAIDRGDMSLEDVITTSEHASSMGGSQIWLEPGETMTVDELLKATVIASANDATVALGEAIAGSEEGFVAMMNEKAKSLGMNNTHFVNCTGLDAEGHLTTAYDIAIMSCELIKHPLIKNYSTVWMDSLRGGESELVNTNKLIRFYSGATGLKTGTTSGAGYCVSATAERDGMELVAVVMGGSTSAERFNGAKKLLDYGFANYNCKNYSPEKEKDTYVNVLKGEERLVKAECKGTINILSRKADKDNITTKINLGDTVTAPIKKGDKIGSISVYLGDEEIGAVDIIAASEVKKLTFKSALVWIISAMFSA